MIMTMMVICSEQDGEKRKNYNNNNNNNNNNEKDAETMRLTSCARVRWEG